MAKLLIVEDNESLQAIMTMKLEKYYDILLANNGVEALNIVESSHVDLIVADIMMPKMNGYDFVRELRSMDFQIPVIMATAKDGFNDKKDGFVVGADDYMVKPVNLDELIWRIDALLKRSKISADREIKIGKFNLNATTFEVAYDGRQIEMTKKEFELALKLLSYPNKLFSKNRLMEDIWGYDSNSDDSTIRTHISRLRSKFADVDEFEIVTVKSLGYKIIMKQMPEKKQ